MEGTLRLIPVLELNLSEYPAGLKPTSASGLHVAVTDLVDPAVLKRLIEVEVLKKQEFDPASQSEQCGSLCGGFILEVSGLPKLVPSCCGDLSNINDWDEASKARNTTWEMLWIGHPWAMHRYRDQRVDLVQVEEGAEAPEHADCSVDPAELTKAIGVAREEIASLRNRMIPVLQGLGYRSPGKVAASMLGLK